MICFHEQGQPSPERLAVEFVQGEKLLGKCSRGHEAPLAVQQMDFQILFDMGGMALLDGYTREAVTSFAASLERAFEFYIMVVSADTNATTLFSEVWKKIFTSDSQRQLGAFAILYLLTEREAPPVANDKWMSFRNRCVHKGHTPSATGAVEYGDYVMSLIERIVDVCKTRHAKSLEKITWERLFSFSVGGRQLTTLSIPTMISYTHIPPNKEPLLARLEQLKSYRQHVWFNR